MLFRSDGVVIVSNEYYQERKNENRLEESIQGECTYEGGYFDIKYMTKDILKDIIQNGSEIMRYLFLNAKTLFTEDEELPQIVAQIGTYPEENIENRFLRLYGTFRLANDYFLAVCKPDGFMRHHVADQIVYHLYRLILLENRILLPCCRRVEECVIKAPSKPEGIVELCAKFLTEQKEEDAKDIVNRYEAWTKMKLPSNYGDIVNNHIDPYESF